jgi:very-short-patch-repair endonuclease
VGSDAACVDWLTRAVQRRLTTPEALLTALERRNRLPKRKLLAAVLGDVASGVHSALEHRYLHDVERAHELVPGHRQFSRPGRAEFIDIAYLKYGLIVELDGRVGHLGRHRDRRRDNAHTRTGLRSLRFGWHEITEDPCGVALEVAELLIGLGWNGYPARCPRCRR